MKAKFVCIEGGDGAGKSTLISKIEKHFKINGIDYLKTREPGGTTLGEEVREVILKKRGTTEVNPRTELLLYEAARAQHVSELIAPTLANGKTVLCDRFTYSSLAYQGYGRGMDLKWITELNHWATEKTEPDLVIWLKIEPSEALGRVQKRSQTNKLDRLEEEKMSFHEKVYAGFIELSKKEPNLFLVLDATVSEEALFSQLLKHPLWIKHFGSLK